MRKLLCADARKLCWLTYSDRWFGAFNSHNQLIDYQSTPFVIRLISLRRITRKLAGKFDGIYRLKFPFIRYIIQYTHTHTHTQWKTSFRRLIEFAVYSFVLKFEYLFFFNLYRFRRFQFEILRLLYFFYNYWKI